MDLGRRAQTLGVGAINVALERVTPLDAARAVAAMDFDRVYEDHFDYVWHCVRRLGVPDKDAEDASHDVFVAVYRHLADYDPDRPMKPWLTGFCHRVAANHRRKAPSRREVQQDHVSDIRDFAVGADERHLIEEQRRAVRTAMDMLDEPRRTVLVLHDLEGHSVPDIAEILQEPEGTLYSRLKSARTQFAAAVRKLVQTGGES